MVVCDSYEWEGGLAFEPNKTRHSIPAGPALSDEERKEAFGLVLRNYFNYSDEEIKEFWAKEERA